MTVSHIAPRSIEDTQPVKVAREPKWAPGLTTGVFIDGRAEMRATIETATNGAPYLAVRIDLPEQCGHLVLSLSDQARLNLADAIEVAENSHNELEQLRQRVADLEKQRGA